MSTLLDMPNLTEGEKSLLQGLREAAKRGRYSECLAQLKLVPSAPVVFHNIAQKGRASGMVPVLENLRRDLQ